MALDNKLHTTQTITIGDSSSRIRWGLQRFRKPEPSVEHGNPELLLVDDLVGRVERCLTHSEIDSFQEYRWGVSFDGSQNKVVTRLPHDNPRYSVEALAQPIFRSGVPSDELNIGPRGELDNETLYLLLENHQDSCVIKGGGVISLDFTMRLQPIYFEIGLHDQQVARELLASIKTSPNETLEKVMYRIFGSADSGGYLPTVRDGGADRVHKNPFITPIKRVVSGELKK
jgi:hypothetical protein